MSDDRVRAIERAAALFAVDLPDGEDGERVLRLCGVTLCYYGSTEDAAEDAHRFAGPIAEAIAAAERDAYERAAQACEGWTTTTVGQSYADGCAARIRKLGGL